MPLCSIDVAATMSLCSGMNPHRRASALPDVHLKNLLRVESTQTSRTVIGQVGLLTFFVCQCISV